MNVPVDNAFKQVCTVIFGEALPGQLDDYAAWLGRFVPLPTPTRSALSGNEVWIPPGDNYLKKTHEPSRTISMAERNRVPNPTLVYSDIAKLTVRDLIRKAVAPIAYYCGDFRYGDCQNLEKCSGGGGINIYYSEDVYFGSKNCGYCNFTSYSENMFGCNAVPFSKFCLHAYNSSNLTRCFEVEGCTNSSDLYFCHNCEGMSNAILCFNAKNLRYAVGNMEVGPEQFARIKKLLLTAMLAELKEKKTTKRSIYSLG
jgi:hypothetical protein